MSQPDTNLSKQARRHAGPIIGMVAVVAFAMVAFLWWLYYESDRGGLPEGAAVNVDGRTGEPEQPAPGTPPPAGTETGKTAP